MSHACRLCRSHNLSLVVDLGSMPIAHRLLERRDQTEEVFPFQVHVCQDCGLIQIVDPIDPGILYDRYNYNFSSWKPEPHLQDELDLICAGGAPVAVAEIGCNDGRFLSELQQRGVALRVGIEPNPVFGSIARDRGHHVHQGMLGPDLVTDIVHAQGFAARSADYTAHLRSSLNARRSQRAQVVLYDVGAVPAPRLPQGLH